MPVLTQKYAHHIIDSQDTSSIAFDNIDFHFESALLYEIKLLQASTNYEGFYPMLDLLMKAVDVISSKETNWVICNFDSKLVDKIKLAITSNKKCVLTKLNIYHDMDETENYEWEPPIDTSKKTEVETCEEKPVEIEDSGQSGLSEQDLLQLEVLRQFTREVSFSAMASADNSLDESGIEQVDDSADAEISGQEYSDVCSPLAEPSLVRSRSLATTSRASSATPDSTFSLSNSPVRHTPSPAVSPLHAQIGKIEAQALRKEAVDFKNAIISEQEKINKSKNYRKNVMWINGFSRLYASRQMQPVPESYQSPSFEELESFYEDQLAWYKGAARPYLAAEAGTQNYINFLKTELASIEEKYLSVSCPQSFFYRLGPKASASSPELLSTLPEFKL